MSDDVRLTRLEERYAHLQRHQTEQDKAMLALSEEVSRLRKEVKLLQARAQTGGGEGESFPTDEKPPHY
ncbi:SlyX family protein [Oleiharenicola lentus]|uniref:SlyX family protein n=1 Tax=Oleiharenicola lentus TaxID=2508720 RepID=UPI003F660EBE